MTQAWVWAAATAAAAIWAAPALAADWAPVAVSNIGDRYDADLSTVTRNGEITRSWIRETLAKPRRDPGTGKMFVQTVAERFDDCARHRYTVGAYVHHDARGGDAGSGSSTGSGWQAIVPGSVADGIAKTVCAVASPPADEAWLEVVDDDSWTDLGASADRKYHLHVRLDRIVRVDDHLVLALTRTDYAEPTWIAGFAIRYVVGAEAIDCATGRSGSLGGDYYLSRTVRVAAQRVPEDKLKLQPAAPGSFIANNLKLICSSAQDVRTADDARGFSVGTAWGVNKGYLVTASHVIQGGGRIEVYDNGEKVGDARVVADDPANDLAILKFTPSRPGKIAILPIAPKTPNLGRSVFVLGYPAPDSLGQRIKMTSGEVSSTAGYQDDARFLQISVPIQKGNSGGPVIAWDGTVVGVVEAKLLRFGDRKDSPAPEMVNYALKASYIRPMLEDLPDLANYTVVKAAGGKDDLVAAARKAVYMVVVIPRDED